MLHSTRLLVDATVAAISLITQEASPSPTQVCWTDVQWLSLAAAPTSVWSTHTHLIDGRSSHAHVHCLILYQTQGITKTSKQQERLRHSADRLFSYQWSYQVSIDMNEKSSVVQVHLSFFVRALWLFQLWPETEWHLACRRVGGAMTCVPMWNDECLIFECNT